MKFDDIYHYIVNLKLEKVKSIVFVVFKTNLFTIMQGFIPNIILS